MAEWCTRATIWIAMGAWAYGIVGKKESFKSRFRTLVPWLMGLIAYLSHILLAYGSFYDWSHMIAWERTADDTAAVVGVRTGVGLLLNFLLGAWLVFDLCTRSRRQEGWATRFTEGLVFFFVLNGSIVFGDGPVVGFGSILCLAIVLKWILSARAWSKRTGET